MSITELIVLLVIAAICGGIGQSIAGYDLGGCLVSIVVGFIGAYIGMWMAGKFGLPEIFAVNIGGKTFPIIWAILGSAVFTLIVVLVRRAVSGGRRF
ncbi:MAG: GlsB/YeaQ/YmgE family stress response membrane protein [Flavisolibacter sp.]